MLTIDVIKFGCIALAMTMTSSVVMANGPQIQLNSKQLALEINATRMVARKVEHDLAEAIKVLESRSNKLESAGCGIEVSNVQCSELRNSLKQGFLIIVDRVEHQLPSLKSSVLAVMKNLESRIGLPSNVSLSNIQASAAGIKERSKSRQPSLRGVSGSSLSKNLKNLQTLVSNDSLKGRSLQAVQSDIYLDMRESLEILNSMEANIAHTRVLASLQVGGTLVTENQISVVTVARQQLFEIDSDDHFAPGLPTALNQDETNFVSDLEY